MNKQLKLLMTIFIITLIFFSVAFFILDIILYAKTGFSIDFSSCIGGLIIIHIICILLCKINTVKIILKNNKSIHIPTRYTFWESIDYKNSVYEFIKEIKICIKSENN